MILFVKIDLDYSLVRPEPPADFLRQAEMFGFVPSLESRKITGRDLDDPQIPNVMYFKQFADNDYSTGIHEVFSKKIRMSFKAFSKGLEGVLERLKSLGATEIQGSVNVLIVDEKSDFDNMIVAYSSVVSNGVSHPKVCSVQVDSGSSVGTVSDFMRLPSSSERDLSEANVSGLEDESVQESQPKGIPLGRIPVQRIAVTPDMLKNLGIFL